MPSAAVVYAALRVNSDIRVQFTHNKIKHTKISSSEYNFHLIYYIRQDILVTANTCIIYSTK